MSVKVLKFRVWDENIGCFDYSDDEVEFYEFFESGAASCGREDLSQQFTGAHDKNGKEIYEGDIVLWDNPDPYNDEEFVTKIVGYNNRTMGYRLYSFPEEIGKAAGASFFGEQVEVIGNIFEGAKKDGVDYGQWRIKQ